MAPQDRVQEILSALRTVLLPARRDRACTFAQITLAPDDQRRIGYVEEWIDEAHLRRQFRTERFVHLLEVLETACEAPVVEFKVFSRTYGLDYIDPDGPAGPDDAGPLVEPDPHRQGDES